MLSFLLLALIADTAPIHTTVADSTRVAFIAQTPISLEVLTVSTFFYWDAGEGEFVAGKTEDTEQ